ncbi:hypothetical protein BKA61DRAFT_619630 [Leptodontidium sp. MPI-SDFR-AT-0119]|nr:hypothetical protein BKA61DRAFT_619630 [Leptodontidium sp. MPI-SDFR-AT-0119]
MKRFALHSKQSIRESPLQVYCSALVFTPMMSIVRNFFEDRLPQWIQQLPKVECHWSADTRANMFAAQVTGLVTSHSGRLVLEELLL